MAKRTTKNPNLKWKRARGGIYAEKVYPDGSGFEITIFKQGPRRSFPQGFYSIEVFEHEHGKMRTYSLPSKETLAEAKRVAQEYASETFANPSHRGGNPIGLRAPEGGRVKLDLPHPGIRALYPYPLPAEGSMGTVVRVQVPGGRKTHMKGPGGGLVYVHWDTGETMGVAPQHLSHVRSRNPKKTRSFKEGDIVRYTTNFLRSTGQYTGVPINGKVVGTTKIGDTVYPMVHWSDRDEAVPVHPGNLELDPRRRKRNVGVSPAEKERRRRRTERGEKSKKRRRTGGRRKKARLPNAPVVPGDSVQISGKGHPRLKTHRSGVVEDVTGNTVWVRLDTSQNLIGVPLGDLKLKEGGPLRGAVNDLLESNPAEIVATAAVAYTDALEEQVRAIRSGDTQAAMVARQQAHKALRELEEAAQQGVAVPAAIGAAFGGGIGAIVGPPVAAVGAVIGSMVGASFARPFRGAERPALPAARGRPAITDGRAAPRREFFPRTAPTPTGARPAPPARPVAVPTPAPAAAPEPAPSEAFAEGFGEGFEEFFEPKAANRRQSNAAKLKRRLLR